MPHLPAPIGLRFAGMAGARGSRDAAVDGLGRFVRADEKFEFHLLKFAGAKREITRVNFISKSLSDLTDAEWNFLARTFEHVFKLDEDCLSSFRAKIRFVLVAFDGADVGLQHQIECAW